MKILKYFLIIFIGFFILNFGLNKLKKNGYRITYQVTKSMPKGFYLITPAKSAHRGDIVLFKPPAKTLSFLLKKKWLPDDGLMLKYVFAVPGDYVYQNKGWIYINHHRIAPIYREYKPGKKLPNNRFCGKLTKHQYLLMSNKVKRSFDGRYFGPIWDKKIIGVAKHL